MVVSHEWLFTEPTEQIYVKRGDPLGWLDIAEKFSNVLAPGISKRTYDARWITILSWCLMVSKNAPLNNTLNAREKQHERYRWLRPIELMWIAHALSDQTDNKGLQLPGRMAVQRWLLDNQKQQSEKDYKFGFTPEQWNRYRYSGIYGAYRVALRKLPGLTKDGDGWTPDYIGVELAKWMEKRLDEEAPKINKEISKRIKREPEQYWGEEYWGEWNEIKKKDLPTSSNEMNSLPKEEQKILRKALFEGPKSERRRIVSETIGKIETNEYSELCRNIAMALDDKEDGNFLALASPFSQFSDSAIDVFNEIMDIINDNNENTKIEIKQLVEYKIVLKKVRLLKRAANNWLRNIDKIGNNTKLDYVSKLAISISDKNKDEIEILKVLINHHIIHGGGQKWFNLIDSDSLESALPISQSNSKPGFYRFRLWQLARMAVQCGVIEPEDIPEVLMTEEIFDDEITR